MRIKSENIHDISRSAILLGFGIPFLLIFSPFTIPILLAIFVAFGVEPILKKISTHTKDRKIFATVLLSIGPLFFLVPLIVFVARLLNGMKSLSTESIKSSQLTQSLLELWGKVQVYIAQFGQTIGADQNIVPSKEELYDKFSPVLVQKAGAVFSALPEFGLSVFVFFCFLYLLISRGMKIKASIANLNFLPQEELDQITQCLKINCNKILVSTLLVGAVQAGIVAVGSLIFGYHEFFLIFCLTFFLSLIPVIGAAPVALLLALISFLNDHTGSSIGLLVVGIIAGTLDNILKPFLLANDDDNLHPLISLLGILGAILVFGLPGLLLGPLITQVSIKVGPMIIKKFI